MWVLQIGLLEVPMLLLDKTMGIFLPVIKNRTSINGIRPSVQRWTALRYEMRDKDPKDSSKGKERQYVEAGNVAFIMIALKLYSS